MAVVNMHTPWTQPVVSFQLFQHLMQGHPLLNAPSARVLVGLRRY